MLKRFKKAATILLAAMVLMVGLRGTTVKAAGDTVVIHVKNNAGWDSMNVYNWGDAGETAGVWPGTAMKEEGDGWYTHTLPAEADLNLVFSTANGTPQSNNVDGVSKSIGECWIVVGGEGEENDLGVKGAQAVLYEKPEEGWPVAAAGEAAEAVKDETPATGDVSSIMPVAMAGLGALGVMVATFRKKKDN
ncbi:hypothetical protein GCM10023142_21960 [Anaerocolumna aminovalerica]|uniref:LPXTG-motif cell wall anchor domain-containing protein n=1 Tax=Anaerocolumna aminovalerica TaxID=1527 RepID=A0A1I5DBX6_9FIRM|nr:starch-binding protein [Anaerocolumna aminovalerica]SFN96702.1 LPXTG-motif cell wall anchor domain-containing protein [Anaerocolumna aminovalerica]